ncbi:MAG: DNA polymerase III subunit chi [Bauldia sp.]
MTEVLFYHLQRRPLEAVLPGLLERTVERNWRAVVQAGSVERVAALDAHLWTYSDDSFLPHGTDAEPDGQPIVLTAGEGNPNGATVRFFVDGAMPGGVDGYERVVIIFDGDDPDALESARGAWRALVAAGHAATYWQQNADGRWEKRAG